MYAIVIFVGMVLSILLQDAMEEILLNTLIPPVLLQFDLRYAELMIHQLNNNVIEVA